MNKRHLDNQMNSIRLWLGDRRMRVKQTIGISDVQYDMALRVQKVKEKIMDLPDDKKIVVLMDRYHINVLFRYTALTKKNLLGFLNLDNNESMTDFSDNQKEYPVFYAGEDEVNSADIILTSVMGNADFVYKKITDEGFKGEFVSIYDEEDKITITSEKTSIRKAEKQNEICNKVAEMLYPKAGNFAYGMLDRINKINKKLEVCRDKKVLIYCVGAHTNFMILLTDIKYKNVVALADRDNRQYMGLEVRTTDPESFEDVDYIVISSYYYQEEIEKYLNKIGYGDKVICLYDKEDMVPFYETPNQNTPDISKNVAGSANLTFTDVYAQLEDRADYFTRNSDFYVSFNMIENASIEKNLFARTSEKKIKSEKNYEAANKKTAIIIQGPVIYEDNFTYRSIVLYKMLFPSATIIVSTWKSEKEKEEFKQIEELGVVTVLSDTPKQKGVLNLNFQLLSTCAGLKKAKEMGCTYALKTRSDFRIYAEDCISYLANLTERFPSKTAAKGRITVLPPILDAPYYIPDFLFFGYTEDLLEMWSDEELFPDESNGRNPEMVLITRYLTKINEYIENPMEDMGKYMDLLCKVFIVVDASTYKYVWRKYSYESSMKYNERENLLLATDWFNRQF